MSLNTQDQLLRDIENELSDIYIEILMILLRNPEWSGLVFDTIAHHIRFWINDLRGGQFPTETELISLEIENLSLN